MCLFVFSYKIIIFNILFINTISKLIRDYSGLCCGGGLPYLLVILWIVKYQLSPLRLITFRCIFICKENNRHPLKPRRIQINIFKCDNKEIKIDEKGYL